MNFLSDPNSLNDLTDTELNLLANRARAVLENRKISFKDVNRVVIFIHINVTVESQYRVRLVLNEGVEVPKNGSTIDGVWYEKDGFGLKRNLQFDEIITFINALKEKNIDVKIKYTSNEEKLVELVDYYTTMLNELRKKKSFFESLNITELK